MTEVHVTGGTGFVGSHLCNHLADDFDAVVALSRSPDEAAVELDPAVERRQADVTRPDALDFEDADVVVHLVALSPLQKPRHTTHHEVTAEGTRNVVDACLEQDVEHLVHLSALGADPEGATEYLRAKAEAEDVVREASVDAAVFRPSVVFGEGGEFEEFARRMTTPYVTALPRGGDTRFQPLWVEDIVEMLAEAVARRQTGVWEVGGPDVLSLAEVCRLIHRADGRDLHVVPVPMPAAWLGMAAADALPFVPMGLDQYRSLKLDNVVEDGNDAREFGFDEPDLRSFADYLGVDADA